MSINYLKKIKKMHYNLDKSSKYPETIETM